jgi:hypothetical protein
MADIIDFKSKLNEKKVEVELEDDGQLLLELSIVSLWADFGGEELEELIGDKLSYLLIFLQFSGGCFQLMEDELIFVDEEGTVSIEQTVKDTLQNGINDAKRELRADNHTTH